MRDSGVRLGLVTAGHREIVEPQLDATGQAEKWQAFLNQTVGGQTS